MLGLRLVSESLKRTKNGQPPHSTTGVASASSIHDRMPAGTTSRSAGTIDPIASSSSGVVATTLTQNRRVMSVSSGFVSSSTVTTSGSSAMPQIGQEPGPSRTICGCIGQVHLPPDACDGGGGGDGATGSGDVTNFVGSAAKRSRQCLLQK